MFKTKSYQGGNVLFIILLGVVLLALLNYAVTQTSSNTTKSSNSEQIGLAVTELLRYAGEVQAAVNLIYTDGGISENDIRFAHPDLDAAYGDPSTLNPEQMVFHPSGGGIDLRPINPALLDGVNTGNPAYGQYYFIANIAVQNIGTSLSELVMILPFLTEDACLEVNKRAALFVTPQDARIFNSVNYTSNAFSGTFASTETLGDDTSLSDEELIIGQRNLCIQTTVQPVANTYHFYQVLLAR